MEEQTQPRMYRNGEELYLRNRIPQTRNEPIEDYVLTIRNHKQPSEHPVERGTTG